MLAGFLDNDLYKFTMQNAVLDHFPGVPVEYAFIARNGYRKPLTAAFSAAFRSAVNKMSRLSITSDELEWLRSVCPYFKPAYMEYLRNYRYDPSEVKITLMSGCLELTVAGPWERAILWEVPLLALFDELYFQMIDKDWMTNYGDGCITAAKMIEKKATDLSAFGCRWAEFGTRRRRSYEIQATVVRSMGHKKGFIGTSNVALARSCGYRPIGTMAHEWVMGCSILDGLRHANRFAWDRWYQTYQGYLSTALPDTYGTGAFLDDFDYRLASLYNGVRHDSGDPYVFGDRVIKHYNTLGIDPKLKTIVFSDNLTTDAAILINQCFSDRIGVIFGIGTHFTNDFPGSPALNVVIKMSKCNGVPVVKLSDDPIKACGDKDALRVANWTFFGRDLNEGAK